MFYTYAHYTPQGRLFYIGKGQGGRSHSFYGRNILWNEVVTEFGNPDVEILANWDTEEEAFSHEVLLISCFRDMGYKLANLTDGGEGFSGFKRTTPVWNVGVPCREETKQKLRGQKIGKSATWNIGRKHSEETKDKMRKTHATYEYRHNMSMVKQGTKRTPDAIAKTSAANRGKKRPLEAITATALANTGKHPTAETLVRLSESHKGLVSGMKGKKHSEETKEKIRNKIRLLLSEKKTGDLPHKENKGVL